MNFVNNLNYFNELLSHIREEFMTRGKFTPLDLNGTGLAVETGNCSE